MGILMMAFMGVAISAVCGWVLYSAAERERRSPWLWGVLGFFFSIIALLVFRFSVGPILKQG